MKRMTKLMLGLLISMLAFGLMFSCENALKSTGTGTLNIEITSALSRAMVNGLDYAEYRIYCDGPGTAEVDMVVRDTSVSLTDLVAGSWTVQVDAYDEVPGQEVAATGSTVIDIIDGQSISTEIVLTSTAPTPTATFTPTATVTATATATATETQTGTPTNLIVNPGAENGTTAWTGDGTTDATEVKSGSAAFLLKHANSLSQDIAVSPNTEYSLTAYGYLGKTDTTLLLSVAGESAELLSAGSWSALTVNFNSGSAGTVTVSMLSQGNWGWIWIDDLELLGATLDPTPTNTATATATATQTVDITPSPTPTATFTAIATSTATSTATATSTSETQWIDQSYEAESAESQVLCTLRSDAAYSGGQYLDMGGNNSAIEWTSVNLNQTGTYTLTVTYDCGEARPVQVYVNGTWVMEIGSVSTGGWGVLGTDSVQVDLSASNTIKIINEATHGGVNVDMINIAGEGIPFTPSPTATSTNTTTPTSTFTPTPTFTGTPQPGKMTIGANFWDVGWGQDGWSWQNYFKEGNNWATVENPWNPTFLAELQEANYSCLRFMDWNKVNDASIQEWDEHVPKTAVHQPHDGGTNKIDCFSHTYDSATNTHTIVEDAEEGYAVSPYWQVDLCNRVGADMWMNIPVTASDNYIRDCANFLKNNLNPGLKVYLEYGNENWNNGFSSCQYSEQMGEQHLSNVDLTGRDCWKWTAYRSFQMFEIFDEVYGTDSTDYVRVINLQWGYHWPDYDINHQALRHLAFFDHPTINPNGDRIDAFATAPYRSLGADMVELAFLTDCVNNTVDRYSGYHIDQICYEGGTGNDFDDPAIEDHIYNYLNILSSRIDGVFNFYTHVGQGSSWDWGMKKYTGQPESEAHKWRGMMRWLSENPNP